ncbi:hypothetical protein MAHJHV63_41670 [Mycobacterium avium subsp. hominissuis]
MVPSYALAYVVLLWTIAFTAKALDGGAGNVDERSGSAQLPYHDLKRHFALARRWELDTTESSTPTDIGSRPVEWCKSGRVSACGSVVATMP